MRVHFFQWFAIAYIFVPTITDARQYQLTCLHYTILILNMLMVVGLYEQTITLQIFYLCGEIYHKRCRFFGSELLNRDETF